MILFHRFTIPDVSIVVYIKSSAADQHKYSLVLLCDQQILCTYVSEIAIQVISSLKWPLWPHINIVLLFLVVERGLNSLFHVTSTSMYYNNSKTRKWHVPKNSLLKEILPSRSFISVLIWEQIVYLILLSTANNVTDFKFFCFCTDYSHIS